MNFEIVTFGLAKGYPSFTGAHKETHGGTDPTLSVYNHRRAIFAAERNETPRSAAKATGPAGIALDKKNLTGVIWFPEDYRDGQYRVFEENLVRIRPAGRVYGSHLVLGVPNLVAAVPVGVWSMKEDEIRPYLEMNAPLAYGNTVDDAYTGGLPKLKALR